MEEAKEKGKELQEERKRLVADADDGDGDDKMTFLVSASLVLFCFRQFPNAEC